MKRSNKKFMRSFIIALLCTAIGGTMMMAGCSGETDGTDAKITVSSDSGSSAADNSSGSAAVTETAEHSVEISEEDTKTEYNADEAVSIKLNGTSAEISGNGAKLDGNTISITSGGTYVISGELTDGQISINAGKDDIVKLVLSGASISSTTTSGIYAEQCGKTIIQLEKGTENSVSDGSDYVTESSESSEDTEDSSGPNAAIYVKDDLTILGEGTLTVKGNAKNGITSKDILRITGGTVNVTAAHHGITGKDDLAIEGGTINVNAEGDGLRSTYSDTDKEEKGHIVIEGGDITVVSGNDGIQAEKTLTINGGTISVTTGGGAVTTGNSGNMGGYGGFGGEGNSTSTEESMKGLKAGSSIVVNGGTIDIDSYDDAVHSNGAAKISSGTLTLSSGDDGIHADTVLDIAGGNVTVSKSYEGLEAIQINISDGVTDITASDDGINAAGGNDSSGFGGMDGNMDFGGRMQRGMSYNESGANVETLAASTGAEITPTAATATDDIAVELNISGGTLYVNAGGDGLDSNSALNISGGTIVVNGPATGGNGIIDHDGNCTVTGGMLIGAGTSDMLEMPGSGSTQKTIAVVLGQTQSAGTPVYITDSSGNVVAAMEPEINYSCLVFSGEALKDGETYTVYTGGAVSGDIAHGYYTNASVSGGTQFTTFSVSDAVTYVTESGASSTYSGGMQGGMGGMQGGMRGGRQFG